MIATRCAAWALSLALAPPDGELPTVTDDDRPTRSDPANPDSPQVLPEGDEPDFSEDPESKGEPTPGAESKAEPRSVSDDVPTSVAPKPDPQANPPAARAGPKPPPSRAAVARQSEVDLKRPRKRLRFQRPGSPQRFALEFKLGPYLPDVDRRYEGPGLGPYATIFGRTNDMGVATRKPKDGVMPVLGFEWQFVYLAGPLGLGTQIAFFRDRANALLAEPEPGENLRSEADRVTFGMVPLALLVTYRFELVADRWKVPLIPYAKAGLAYAFWWTKNGSGKVSKDAGGQGQGGVWGWQINAGGMLRLDFLEPGTAKKLDVATGINHTFLFGEYQLLRLANFGTANSISIGDGTWFVGLGIEF